MHLYDWSGVQPRGAPGPCKNFSSWIGELRPPQLLHLEQLLPLIWWERIYQRYHCRTYAVFLVIWSRWEYALLYVITMPMKLRYGWWRNIRWSQLGLGTLLSFLVLGWQAPLTVSLKVVNLLQQMTVDTWNLMTKDNLAVFTETLLSLPDDFVEARKDETSGSRQEE